MSFVDRPEVRHALIVRGWSGWSENALVLRRGRTIWAGIGAHDCSVSRYRDKIGGDAAFTLQFPADVPAHVIIAACEAAARGERRAA